MKRLIIMLLATASLMATAAPVGINTARKAALQHLANRGLLKGDALLTTATVQVGTQGDTCFYVFNIGDYGFIIMSADDRCVPVLGNSTNGIFDSERLPINMQSWIADYAYSIDAGIQANAPFNKETFEAWQQLLEGANTANGAKSDTYLVQSTWEQGWGYNNYCPINNGNHVVVGCVATAMSQVIRYYQYPNYGFGSHHYNGYYGTLSAQFDTSFYNYSLMPNRLSYGSSDAQIHAVALLCYHCGVAVDMTYQNPGHTSGSGAFTSDVPKALEHFGYFGSELRYLNTYGEDIWSEMLRSEISAGHPLVYAGHANEGGHAFVCDGFYDDAQMFHFNWGWGGYADGFYSLYTMQGFTRAQCAVFNMRPSGISSQADRYYISPNGNGYGSSWQDCSSDYENIFHAALAANKEVWMLHGTYYGTDSNENAFTLPTGISLYGSLTEADTSVAQIDIEAHPTIIDGRGTQRAFYCQGGKSVNIQGLVIQNGYSANSAAVHIGNKIQLSQCVLKDNHADSSSAIYLTTCNADRCRMANNSGNNAITIDGATLRNCLIANNSGNGISINNKATLLNCNVVRNAGYGIQLADSTATVRNTLVWGNDTTFSHFNGTAVTFCAMDGDSLYQGNGNIRLDADNMGLGPQFHDPSPFIGYDSLALQRNWRLMPTSPCIDKADSNRKGVPTVDLDGLARRYHGRIDIGCYEAQAVGIATAEALPSLEVYPNPCQGVVHVDNGGLTITIFDMMGRCLKATRQSDIDIRDYPNGTYIIKVGTQHARLIKR